MARNLATRKGYGSCSETPSHSSYDSTAKSKELDMGQDSVEFRSLKPRKKCSKRHNKSGQPSDTSTSEGPAERETSRASRRRMINPSVIASEVTSSRQNEDGNPEETRSLLDGDRAVKQNYSGPLDHSVREPESPPAAERHRLPEMDLSTKRHLSSVLFLLVLVMGMSFVVSLNLTSDSKSMEITPRVVNIYTILLIAVFMIWFSLDLLANRNCNDTIAGQSGSLIPSHLLNGLALFGVGSSVCQVVTVVDFVKCQKHVHKLDASCLAYPFFEMAFMFLQMYVFYTLSKNRDRKMLYGNAFTMFTLAVNLTIWAKYFFASAASSPNLENETWLTHYHYGVPYDDLCSGNATSANSRKLHHFRVDMMPFMYTLTMEYALLASALLLHLWLEIGTPNAGEYGAMSRIKWEIWRVGFIAGLFSLPLLGTIAVTVSVDFKEDKAKVTIVYFAELFLLLLLLACSFFGLRYIKKWYVADKKPKMRIDIILLITSWIGFLVYDLFAMFAAVMEVAKKGSLSNCCIIGVVSFVELLSTGILTTFLTTAYSHKLPLTIDCDRFNAAKKIRQIGSFCLIVSFGFWAMRSYTFRSKHTFDVVGYNYFGSLPWFVITQLSVPFCTFFHFHSAVCFNEVIAGATT